MTINERISLNKEEYYDLLRSYLEYAFEALRYGYLNITELRTLFGHLKEYSRELDAESYYLKILDGYKHRITEEDLDRLLNNIDVSNEDTYNFYEAYGEYYSDKAFPQYRSYEPRRKSPRIQDNTRITDEIKGLTLGTSDLFKYFKGSDAYYYAQENAKIVDGGDNLWLYGVNIDEEHGILRRYRMIVPPIKDLRTALINVHEYRHALDLFDLIGKEYPVENDFEERARAEEEKFVREYVRNK